MSVPSLLQQVAEANPDVVAMRLKDTDSTLRKEWTYQALEEEVNTVARALLDDRSREVLTQPRPIYDRILEFQTIANRIHDDTGTEWDARQTIWSVMGKSQLSRETPLPLNLNVVARCPSIFCL